MNDISTIVAPEKSTHCVETFILKELIKHPDADTLSVIKIGDTDYTYVAKTEEWIPYVNQTVAWIPPDSLVNTTMSCFNFLIKDAKYDKNSDTPGVYARIRQRKIRGIVSYGILIPLNSTHDEDDLILVLDVHHYDPDIIALKSNKNKLYMGGEVAASPSGVFYKYDVDSFLKYGRKCFVEGEDIIVTQKLHGANSRFVFKDGKMYCGSRTEWKKEYSSPPTITLEQLTEAQGEDLGKLTYEKHVLNFKSKKNMWWQVLEDTLALRAFCEKYEGYCVYGEVYGQIQKGHSYDAEPGKNKFRAFDILTPEGCWVPKFIAMDLAEEEGLPWVPLIGFYKFNFEEILKLAEGNSLIGKGIKEGVVISPVAERWDERFGRTQLKIINPEFK